MRMSELPSFDYDVFVSYASREEPWVRGELLKRLAGLKALIGVRDPARAIVCSRQTLVILTPSYLQSEEWSRLQSALQETSHTCPNPRLRALIKSSCETPSSLGALTAIDFSEGPNLDLAWRQLLTALGIPPAPPPVDRSAHGEWLLVQPCAPPPDFTGRTDERAMLTGWLDRETSCPLLVLRAPGGSGKTALAWHWLLQDVSLVQTPRVVWWSFSAAEASFEVFLERALKYLSDGRPDPASLGPRQQLDALLQALRQPGTLLILDGFEHVLRAGPGSPAASDAAPQHASAECRERDCTSFLAEVFLRGVGATPGIRGKILLTTQQRPRALELSENELLRGCREEQLQPLAPADAVKFFWSQGIRGTGEAIEAACQSCGCSPLSLRLLAGLVARDSQQPGDIAVARRLESGGDPAQRQQRLLETSCESLAPTGRAWLENIACLRGPVTDSTLQTLVKAGDASGTDLNSDLRELVARGWLHHDRAADRFDLHPILRDYLYGRLASSERAASHARWRDYFASVPKRDRVANLEDLVPFLELYHHTVRSGQLDAGLALFRERIHKPVCYELGAYRLEIELLDILFAKGENCPPPLQNAADQAWVLNEMANACCLCGQPIRAVVFYERLNEIHERQGDQESLAVSLINLASPLLGLGRLRAAESSLRRSLALCQELHDEHQEAIARRELGRVLAYRGVWSESEMELAKALTSCKRLQHAHAQGQTWSYRALSELLRLRIPGVLATPKTAASHARQALILALEWAQNQYPIESEQIRNRWLLGAARRVAGQRDEAERYLDEALERCRRLHAIWLEADILVDLARLRAANREPEEAATLAREAMFLAEHCGYVLQSADAHLALAQLAQGRGDATEVRHHATAAQRLAACDGPPDYSYKVAYDEATTLLAGLGAEK